MTDAMPKRGKKGEGRATIRATAEMRPSDHARWKASGRTLNDVIRAGLDALNL